jgi:hypothetical protein
MFRGEARLHAFDFWMRNPDYLADELLQRYEATQEQRLLDEAESIFRSEEPDIRRVPMIRFKFGAYERIDDAIALLRSRGLVTVLGRRSGVQVREWDFLLMRSAVEFASAISAEFPVLNWYAQRANLVAEIAGNRGGDALKQQQYKQVEYASTQLGGIIPPIAERVLARLQNLQGVSAR